MARDQRFTGWPLSWLGERLAGRSLRPDVAVGAGVVALCSLGALVWGATVAPVEGNPASRLSSIETIVEHRDWSIDRSVYLYTTVDKVYVGHRFFSSKPPMYAALGTLAYGAMALSTNTRFESTESLAVFNVRLWMQILPFMLGLILAGRFLGRSVVHDGAWFWGFLAFGLGTFVFGYSGDINNHSLAALLVLAGLAGGAALDRRGHDPWVAFGIGFCGALAATLDFGAAAFTLALMGFVMARTLKSLPLACLGALVPVLVHIGLTHHLTGSVLPFYGRGALYDYPGSYWLSPGQFDALNEPTWVYVFHSLVGHHGFFAMTPVFFLAVPGLVGLVRRPAERPVGLLAVAAVTSTLVVYLFWAPRNYGGMAQGMRWLIVIAPLTWYAGCRFADRRWSSPAWRWIFGIAVVIGIFHATSALWGPWSVSPWNELFRRLGMGSVPPFNGWLR